MLNLSLVVHPWDGWKQLPTFVAHTYRFFETQLEGSRYVLMLLDKNHQRMAPGAIQRDWKIVCQKSGLVAVVISPAISSYHRRRLIELRIPFIVPNNQMYLPDLGIDLRELYLRSNREVEIVSPATQVVLIDAILYGPPDIPYSSTYFMERLGYTRMTIIRAFDELEALGIGRRDKRGRERCWIWEGRGNDLWETCRPKLRSPIIQRHIWIDQSVGLKAGLTALSERSQLAPPVIPIYAIGSNEWREFKRNEVKVAPEPIYGSTELQVWCYAPGLLSVSDTVDPLSLYLSLQDDPDERVEIALEELMKGIPWCAA